MYLNLMFVSCYYHEEKFVVCNISWVTWFFIFLWKWQVRYKDNDIIFKGFWNSNICQVLLSRAILFEANSLSTLRTNSLFIWHLQLDHISNNRINIFVKSEILTDIERKNYLSCVSCIYEKMIKLHFPFKV